LADVEDFGATVPFGIGRWVIGLKLPFPQALAGVDFLGSDVRKNVKQLRFVGTEDQSDEMVKFGWG
jgi:hypothetical protein